MAVLNLQLKDPTATNSTRIRGVLQDGRNVRIRIYSDVSVLPKHWSKKNQNVLSADPEAVVKNTDLKEFKNAVLSIYNEAKHNGIICNSEYIIEQLRPKVEAETETIKSAQFWDVWQYFMEEKRQVFTIASIKKYNSLKEHITGFEKYSKIPLHLDRITPNVMLKLQTYFYEVKNLNVQTTSKYIGFFNAYLNWAVANKYTTNIDYKQFKRTNQPRTLKVILTATDIEKIKAVHLGTKDYLANVRELLILSCLVGLRYSDYSRLKPEHIKTSTDGSKSIQIMQKKTNEYVEIPLTPESLAIIQKLFAKQIRPISNQKMNSYAKELCQLAGIDDPTETIEHKGKLKVTKTVAKWELVTTHTGRRTFATHLLMKGVPAQIVMEFTGHKDYTSFQQYVNVPVQSRMDMVRIALMG